MADKKETTVAYTEAAPEATEQSPVTYTEAAPVYTVDNQQVALSYAEQQQMAQKKKKRRNTIIGVLIGVVVVAVLVVAFLMIRRASAQSNASDYVTAQVQSGSIEKTISGSGQLKANTTSEVNAKVSGTVTGLSVKLGSEVTTGTVLFTVDDNGTLADAVTSASNSLSAAKLSLTSAQQSLKSAEAASTTTAAELMAQSKSGASISNADAGTSSLGAGGGGKGSGAGSGAGAGSGTGANSSSSSSSSSGTLTMAQAKAQAAQANAQRAASIASAQAQVKQAQAQVTSAQSDYDTAVKNAGETAVTAPASGIVTALGVANGDSVTGSSSTSSTNNNSSNNNASNNYSSLLGNSSNNSSNNNSSSSSSSAVEISDYSSAMTADISVSESDISSVQKGQGVNLSFSAFPSLEASGTVTQVSPTGTSSGSLVDFTVTMTLKDPDKQLRPGMSVTAEIVTASAKNVLLVPNTAIDQASDGTYTVRVAQNGDTTNLKTVTVTVGVANDSYTEVKSGLAQGDIVISGTTASTSSNSSSGGGLFGGGGGGMRIGGGNYTNGGGNVRTFSNGGGGGSAQQADPGSGFKGGN